jgi:ribosomal protein L27
MATSTNYGWAEPDNSSLVKNGASDIRTLGNAIDTSVWNVGYGQAGKNKIINGNFGIWQRGTSFTPATGVGAYTADRYFVNCNFSAGTATFSQQTFTPGTAPVAGYEGTYFHRIAAASTTSYFEISQKIEDVRTNAGQTVTVSFYAKQSASIGISLLVRQNFGSGGSANVDQSVAPTITSSWARYSYTFTLGSMTGKTIGAGSYVQMYLYTTGAVTGSMTFDTWGWQVEYGSVATPFQIATATYATELAACQRYYQVVASGTIKAICNATGYTSTGAYGVYNTKVTMRAAPTISQVSGSDYYGCYGNNNAGDTFNSFSALSAATPDQVRFDVTSGISITQGYSYWFETTNASAFLAVQAEL